MILPWPRPIWALNLRDEPEPGAVSLRQVSQPLARPSLPTDEARPGAVPGTCAWLCFPCPADKRLSRAAGVRWEVPLTCKGLTAPRGALGSGWSREPPRKTKEAVRGGDSTRVGVGRDRECTGPPRPSLGPA